MKIPFFKYHGTGNDFVMIDNRNRFWGDALPPKKWIESCCHRRFGIGADGFILLQSHPNTDFEMIYFNADGGIGSMCGNGGRCAVAFAQRLGLIDHTTRFIANDGEHLAIIAPDGHIKLKMSDVHAVETIAPNTYFANTGSPHYVEIVEKLDEVPVVEWGRAIRNNERFKEEGTNVNFMQILDKQTIFIGTYERGVEDETYSCGTGAVASAVVFELEQPSNTPISNIAIKTKGGDLFVQFEHASNHSFYNVWLCGPAVSVFSGEIEFN